MRVVLFTGGEDAAVVARATAVLAARRGHRTAYLGAAEGSEPGLQVVAPQPLSWLESAWPPLAESVLRAAECPVLPAVRELELWSRLRTCLRDPQLDAIVLAAGSCDEALALLSLPESLPWVLERAVAPQDPVTGALLLRAEELRAGADRLRESLPSIRLVLRAEAGMAAAARAVAGRFGCFGQALDGVVAAGLVPAGSDPWLAATGRAQQQELEAVQADFPTLPVHRWGWGADPIGLYGDADPLSAGPAAEVPALSRDDADYVWNVPLPFTEREQLSLVRSGEYLILTRGQDRRILSLPPLLRRCTITSSALQDGELSIRFHPDPAVWREPVRGSAG